MNGETVRTLVLDVLGPQFIAYVLNMDLADVDRLREPTAVIESQREAAIQELAGFITTMNLQGGRDDPFWHLNLDVLAMVQPPNDQTWCNSVRAALGGSVELRPVRGTYRQLLVQLARDVYPVFLIPTHRSPIPDPFAPSLTRALFQHPLHGQFEAALMRDPALQMLFPEDRDGSGPTGWVTRSTGSGGTLQLAMLPDLLLKSGWRLARLTHTTPTLNQFQEGVIRAVDTVRAAAAGRQATIPVRIGIAGVLPEGTMSVDLPWGRLRPFGPDDAELMPQSLDQQLSTTTAQGENITISYGGNLVLEMDVPYRLRAEVWDPDRAIAEWPADLRGYELIQERLETVQLALLLGVDKEPKPKVLSSWHAVFDPLDHGATKSWRDVASMQGLVPCRLTRVEFRRWQTWAQLVDERRTPSISVAINRTLLAALERRDPADALLDAVIAWENLVGADEGETTLRITTSLAWLLTSRPADRDAKQKQLRDLYKLRSRIVHGSPRITPRDAGERYQEALSITLAALRALFQKRPDLLQETTSSARSRRLMLKT